MLLGPACFSSADECSTFHLRGKTLDCGHLFFNPDSTHLISYSDAYITVWEISSRSTCFHLECDVRSCGYSARTHELLVVTSENVLLVSLSPGVLARVRRRYTLDTQLVALLEQEVGLYLRVGMLADHSLLLCTHTWFAVLRQDGEREAYSRLPQHQDRQVQAVGLTGSPGTMRIRIASLRVTGSGSHYYASVYDTAGSELSAISVSHPAAKSINAADRTAAILLFPLNHPFVAAIGVDSAAAHVWPLDHGTCEMLFSLSAGGTYLAGATAALLTIWTPERVVSTSACDGTPFTVRVSDEGNIALLTYDPGDDSRPVLSGVISVRDGKPLASCRGHLFGTASYAFSPLGKYFASVITNGDAGYHGNETPSGTVIVSKLPGPAS